MNRVNSRNDYDDSAINIVIVIVIIIIINSLICADVPLRNCSLTHSLCDLNWKSLDSGFVLELESCRLGLGTSRHILGFGLSGL